jgi:hypothetical protein
VNRKTARKAIADALEGITLAGRPVTVFDGIPRTGDAPRPSIVVNYTGATSTELQFQVEVYVGASDGNVQVAQDSTLELMDKIDAKIETAGLGPQSDQIETLTYSSDLDAWVGLFAIFYPRTDFG